MLLRTTDPFRDFDRLTQQLLGTTNRPVVMPMDAWREGDRFVIEFDLPGVSPQLLPGTWAPHVTLARKVPTAALGAAIGVLGELPELVGNAVSVRRWDSEKKITWRVG